MSTTRETLTILLLARKGSVLDETRSQLLQGSANEETSPSPSPSSRPDLRVYAGTTVDDLRSAFDQASREARTIQHVFVGAGLELEHRLEIVKEIITLSGDTSVHLKEATSGPGGFLPFIQAVLGGQPGRTSGHSL
ncbi:uncharacterized protein PV07_11747 [Cladophialophora immunda]|uniref:Uncharacterized protein n=1 Tax=Cladophialophora immunda TaxID=569365 RepID=A0A0D2BWW8_9EURO|nr:uncharacterized protein PV07_11747 [Cladophialophora immunda]KIW23558.1 hypothetical protein PV07_11747 [Cladophialophora immunda]